MDVTFLAVAVAVLLAILVLVAIFYYSSRETTFEEAYGRNALKLLSEADEQTKKAAGAGGAKGTAGHQKHKHKPKKLQKTTNASATGEKSSSDQDHAAATVESSEEAPELVEANNKDEEPISEDKASLVDCQTASKGQEVRQRKKHKPHKHSEGSEKSVEVSETEAVKRESKIDSKSMEPKEAKKQQMQQQKTDVVSNEAAKGKVAEKGAVVEEELIQAQSVGHSQAAPPAGKKKKQKGRSAGPEQQQKSEPTATTTSGKISGHPAAEPDVDLVIEQLKQTPLNEAYLSLIVESLLMRQSYASQNAKHLEETGKLKKQMEDKDKAVAQHMQTVNAAQQKDLQKFKDLNQQLQTERTKYLTLEKSAVDQIKAKTQEAENLARQLQMVNQDQHTIRETLRKTMETANPQMIEQLRKDLHMANDRAVRMEAECNNRSQQIANLQKDIHNRDQQLRGWQNEKRDLETKVQELSKNVQLQKVDDKTVELLKAKEAELTEANKQIDELKVEFLELEKSALKIKAENEKNRETLTMQNGDANLKGQQNGDINTSVDLKELKKKEKQVAQLSEDLKKSEEKKSDLEGKLKEQKQLVDSSEKDKKELEKRAEKEHKETDKVIKDLMAKVESLEKEKDKLNEKCHKQDELKNKDLESALNAKNKLESELKDLKASVENKCDENVNLERQLSDFREELDSAHKQNSDLETKEGELQAKIDNLTKELDTLKEQLEQKGRDEADVAQNGLDLKSLQEENVKLKSDIETLREQNIAKNEHGHRLARELQSKVAYIDKLESERLVEPVIEPKSVAPLGSSPAAGDGDSNDSAKLDQVTKELEEQRRKNDELRQKNYKVVEAVTKVENTSKLLVQDVENKYKKLLDEQRAETAKILSSALPKSNQLLPKSDNVPIGQETFQTWIHEVATAIKGKSIPQKLETLQRSAVATTATSANVASNTSAVVPDSGEVVEELRANLKSYKNVLLAVEQDLQELEASSAQQEKLWRQKCKDLEAELLKAKSDARECQNAMKSQLSDEVKIQLVNMQTKLNDEEKARDTLKKELVVLQQQLLEEQKTGRDLSSQAVKLRGMLKTGQDALQYEQNLVAQLKQQLTDLQTDGGSSKDGGYLEMELKSLRDRLDDREKQLSRETQVNKQMADKLAALGLPLPDTVS